MGGGASTGRQPLHALSADGVRDLFEGIGPKFSDLAKHLHDNDVDGEYLASAPTEDLAEIFDEFAIPKLKQKVLLQKLGKLKEVDVVHGLAGHADDRRRHRRGAAAPGVRAAARGRHARRRADRLRRLWRSSSAARGIRSQASVAAAGGRGRSPRSGPRSPASPSTSRPT